MFDGEHAAEVLAHAHLDEVAGRKTPGNLARVADDLERLPPGDRPDVRQQAQCAGGTQPTVFIQVSDIDAEPPAVAEMAADHLALVVEAQVQVDEALFGKVLDDGLEYRLGSDRYHRLGRDLGQRSQAGAQSAGHDHDRGGALGFERHVVLYEVHDAPPGVEYR